MGKFIYQAAQNLIEDSRNLVTGFGNDNTSSLTDGPVLAPDGSMPKMITSIGSVSCYRYNLTAVESGQTYVMAALLSFVGSVECFFGWNNTNSSFGGYRYLTIVPASLDQRRATSTSSYPPDHFHLEWVDSNWLSVAVMATAINSSNSLPLISVVDSGATGAFDGPATVGWGIAVAGLRIAKSTDLRIPYIPTSGTAISSGMDFVRLLPEWDYRSASRRIEESTRSRSGKLTRYKYGERREITLRDTHVPYASAVKVNSWWRAGVPVVLQDDLTLEVTTGYITNKAAPAGKFNEPYSDEAEVVIELETY